MREDMQSRLHACCARAFPTSTGVQVSNLTSIATGWENEMYAFDVEYEVDGERQREGLVLRIYPGDDAYGKSAREFHGMRQLRQAGYPVPRVLLLERENSPLGKPFVVMERIEGQELWSLLSSSSAQKQQELLTLFCELFVRLHTLDWRPFVDDIARYAGGGRYAFIDQWLSAARGSLKRFPRSDLHPLVEWLEKRRNQAPCLQPSLVHGDFHPSNVLRRDDGSVAVIDWTGLRVSDARFDLAWTLILANSYVGAEWRNRILHEYERLRAIADPRQGTKVEQIEYFEVCACCRRLSDVGISLSEGAEKRGMRPGAVTMMKQQKESFERVYSLLVERTGIKVTAFERLLASLG
jgi:aminoglycoside phosphotransferase (APT) family kinase protein